MKLKERGKTSELYNPIVGRVTRDPNNKDYEVFITDLTISHSYWYGFKVILTTIEIEESAEIPLVHSIKDLKYLNEGDIVIVNTDGVINTVYRQNSNHNFLLFTERCNSNCLMCSQPPKDKDDTEYFYQLYKKVVPMIPTECQELGITGGEPTLLGKRFFDLVNMMREYLPQTRIHCLTNGRSFAWENLTEQLANIDHKELVLAIPLYSDVYYQHDYIVQAKNAFNQTIRGLYNLARYEQRIEIRIVLHKQTIPRLVKLARFIYKNLPFVEHIAFMGLEHEGYTPYNIEKLWIDPVDYQNELTEAVELLAAFGMNVSIYNAQLCTLPKPLWEYARQSISDWKNIYFEECNHCSVLEECGGMFASGVKKHSDYIKAL